MPKAETKKILIIGEPVGKIARQALQKKLPSLIKKYSPDFVITNCENLSHGSGANTKHIQEMRDIGIDFFTSGNHIWNKPEIIELLKQPNPIVLRPANYPADLPGTGVSVAKTDKLKILVVNLQGRVFMKNEVDDPFRTVAAIKEKHPASKYDLILVDFHAEATSEKRAMGFYLDGWASVVYGTHTHIATADGRVLPKGTAYVSDIGMTGSKDSVLGVDKEIIINNFLTPLGRQHEVVDKGTCEINANVITINTTEGKATEIERIYAEVEV